MDSVMLARWRLRNLLLRGSTARTPGEVIGTLAASQGQDFLPGLWAVAQRTVPVTTYAEAAEAFDRGEVLRTHVLRPTWHLVAPQDLRWLQTATAPRVHRLDAYYNRRLGIDESSARQVCRVLERVLPGRQLTREELGAELGASGQRLAYLLLWAELEQWICSGPRSGGKQTYALVSDRAGADGRSREEALAELARRYFATRAPATVKDLAGWASLTMTEARAARTTLSDFEDLVVDGRTYVVRGDPPPEPEVGEPPVIDLVQAYDESIMSYSESKDVLTAGRRVFRGPATSFMHAILLEGRLFGHWRYERDAHGLPARLQTYTYRPPTPAESAALRDAVARFEHFAGREITVESRA